MIIPQRNAKEYGAVHIDNYLTFTGFCKKVSSEDICDVDVYIDGKIIQTIVANKSINKIEQIYDIQGHGFEYNLEEKYFEKSHLLEFKSTNENVVLVNSGIQTIDKSNIKFNEYKFMHSLTKKLPEDIKKFNVKNSIGILAEEYNLKDEIFINYIKELGVRFRDITIKVFYFRNSEEDSIKSIFKNIKNIEFILLHDVIQLVENIEIMIFNEDGYDNRNLYIYLFKYINQIIPCAMEKRDITIETIDYINSGHELITDYNKFGLTKLIIDKYDQSFTRLMYEKTYHDISDNSYVIDKEMSSIEFYNFERINLILNIPGYKNNLNDNRFGKML